MRLEEKKFLALIQTAAPDVNPVENGPTSPSLKLKPDPSFRWIMSSRNESVRRVAGELMFIVGDRTENHEAVRESIPGRVSTIMKFNAVIRSCVGASFFWTFFR
jgi:hypothetical protein